MSLVIDTGVLVAAARADDPDHEACRTLLESAPERRVIPAPVLVEVEYFLRGDASWSALLRDVVEGGLSVEELRLTDYERIGELAARYEDLGVGFVDCAVLAVVERFGETKLATLDRRHFSVLRPAHTGSLELLPV